MLIFIIFFLITLVSQKITVTLVGPSVFEDAAAPDQACAKQSELLNFDHKGSEKALRETVGSFEFPDPNAKISDKKFTVPLPPPPKHSTEFAKTINT